VTKSRKAKWAALLAVSAVAIAQAGVGTTFGAFAAQSAAAGNVITAMPDFRGPNVTPLAIGKNTGNGTGAILPGAAYRVYAQVTDVGTPPSGTASVTANVSAVTAGQTAVPLVAGTYTAGGVSYNYRSAVLTATAGVGTHAFTVTATDAATNVTTANGSVAVDSTAPAPTNIAASGGTLGRLDVGDTLTLTTNDILDTFTILAGWDGSATTVRVVLDNDNGGDLLEIRNASGAAVLPFGTINLGRTDFIAAAGGGLATFPASTMTQSGNAITVVLGGTVTGTPTTAAGTGTMVWTPSATVRDRAGNAMATAAFNEPAPLDRDF
jgi:hypothetical protein